MSNNKQIRMLDELQGLLEKQIELARQGDSAGEQIERLGRQVDCLVEKISHGRVLERLEFEGRRKQLQKSYEDLRLVITAQKADVADKLNRVRKGKRTIETYRNNI
jgi:hypothetical protein